MSDTFSFIRTLNVVLSLWRALYAARGVKPRMSPEKSRSRKQSNKRQQAKRSLGTRSNGHQSKHASHESERIRTLDALNLYRQGKAKTVSAAARMAETNLKAMWRWVP